MKKLILIIIVIGFLAVPALGAPTLTFARAGSGGWTYTASGPGMGTFSFTQSILVLSVQESLADPLVFNGFVHIPSMTLAGGAGGPYTLTPISSTFLITNFDGSQTFLIGTLGNGTFVINDETSASGYTAISADITGITSPSNLIASPIVVAIAAHGSADFSISLDWDQSFTDLIDQTVDAPSTGSNGMSGQITIPAPGAILLGSIGVGLVGWLRRRRTL